MLRPLSWYRDLNDPRVRKEAWVFLVEGTRAIRQILRVNPDAVKELLVAGESLNDIEVACPVRAITPEQLRRICTSQNPQGPLAVVAVPPHSYHDAAPDSPGGRILLLEHVQDPGNVGTLIRSASALGFDGVILSDQCADPFSPKAVAASAGTVLSVWIRRTREYLSLARELRNRQYALIATDAKGVALRNLTPALRCILALGNEGTGLSAEIREFADYVAGIPIDDVRAESLNVATCGSICMYELGGGRKRSTGGLE